MFICDKTDDCSPVSSNGQTLTLRSSRGVFLVPLHEAVNTTFRVHNFLCAGVIRMAVAANFNANLLLRRAHLNRIPANASGSHRVILRMNTVFHLKTLSILGKNAKIHHTKNRPHRDVNY
jgi:hypothetical protein